MKIFRLEFRGVFSDTAATLYKKTVTLLQEKLKPIIVSAMLDHDSLQGTTQGKSIEVKYQTYTHLINSGQPENFVAQNDRKFRLQCLMP